MPSSSTQLNPAQPSSTQLNPLDLMPTYLSIDVATKSLALGIYQIAYDVCEALRSPDSIDSMVMPIAMQVHDLDPSKSAKEITISAKATALKEILTRFDAHLPSGEFIVLIEYQMNVNHMSNAIFNMLVYHYAGRAPVHTVFPSLKNSIHLHPSLKLSCFLATASSNYTANKNHCKFNFLYFMVLFGHGPRLAGVRQKNMDDIADTFMQCLAFHKAKGMLSPGPP